MCIFLGKKINKGFTLLEVLLSITLVSALLIISTITYYPLMLRNELTVAVNQTTEALARASFLASGAQSDSEWGVKLQTGSATVFKGTSYSESDLYNEVYSIAQNVSFSGLTEIVFSKMTGLPQSTGTITLTSSIGSKNVTINSKGTVSY
jgi:prepilin-type N-terminal cleavage/methylation domain-containing protein